MVICTIFIYVTVRTFAGRRNGPVAAYIIRSGRILIERVAASYPPPQKKIIIKRTGKSESGERGEGERTFVRNIIDVLRNVQFATSRAAIVFFFQISNHTRRNV